MGPESQEAAETQLKPRSAPSPNLQPPHPLLSLQRDFMGNVNSSARVQGHAQGHAQWVWSPHSALAAGSVVGGFHAPRSSRTLCEIPVPSPQKRSEWIPRQLFVIGVSGIHCGFNYLITSSFKCTALAVGLANG